MPSISIFFVFGCAFQFFLLSSYFANLLVPIPPFLISYYSEIFWTILIVSLSVVTLAKTRLIVSLDNPALNADKENFGINSKLTHY